MPVPALPGVNPWAIAFFVLEVKFLVARTLEL